MGKENTKSKSKAEVKSKGNQVTAESIRLDLLKQFGANSVITGSDLEKCTYGRIRTGSISLDLALGGGIPIGRAIQISGAKSTCKTSLCNHVAVNAQNTKVKWIFTERKNDKGREIITEHPREVDELICGYIDAEGTQDEAWMRKIGVDTSKWLYNKPSGLEEALNIAHAMQLKGVNLVFIDSIDSLEPVLYYETEAGESARMGEKQKQIGEYLRKFTTTNNRLEREGRLPCTLVLLNQLREKIGCFHYTSPVLLEDGSTEMIGKIVTNKMPVKVMSLNEATGELEPKQVTNWFDNGVNEGEFITIFTDRPQGNGKSYLACTPNHKILTPEGYVEAGAIKEGDVIIQYLKDKTCNYTMRHSKVLEIGTLPREEFTHRYDIEVADNHNYLVDNLVVHNCYGDPEYTPGGRAIEFYMSIDLRLRRGDWISVGTGEDKHIIGQVVKFKTNKNKTFRQQQVGEFDFYFDDTDRVSMAHIDNAKEIIVEGIAWGVIERAGAWFKYKGNNLAQGADNTVHYLLEHPDIFNSVREELFNLVQEGNSNE